MNSRVLACVLAFTLSAAPAVFGWIPIEDGVWPDGPIQLTYGFATTAPNHSTNWDAAADEALAAWNPYLQRVQIKKAGSGSPGYDNDRNELFFDRQMYGETFPDGVLAVTCITSEKGQLTETDVVFNSLEPWSVYSGELQQASTDLRRVAIHELGHVLGIGHPDEIGQKVPAIMNSTVSGIERPTDDDQTAAHALYDRGAGSPPIIISSPSSTTVQQGEDTALIVAAGGRGPLSYVWKHNGTAVAGATSPLLLFTSATLADAGDYTAVVNNSGGSVTSAVAHLTVNAATAPTISGGARSVVLTVGADYLLSANNVGGSYPMTFEWKNGSTVIGHSTTPSFTLSDVQLSNAGTYSVTASNIVGNATAAVLQIAVEPGSPPRLRREPVSAALVVGQPGGLTAEASGSGPFTYRWKKDGVDLAGAMGNSIEFYPFKIADAGTYTLTVSNRFGQVTSQPVVLSVLASGGPVITTQSPSVSEYPGASIPFSVSTSSSGPITWQWLKDGVALNDSPAPGGRIIGTTSSNLLINQTSANDTGWYVLQLSNASGATVSDPIHLTVLQPTKPVLIAQPSPHSVPVGGSVNLTVTPRPWFANWLERSTTTGYRYQWYKDGQPVPGQTSDTFEFTAKASDAGFYFVRVTSAGGSTDSDQVEVEITATRRVISRHPPSTLYDATDAETLRLADIAFQVNFRRMIRDSGYSGDFIWQQNGAQVSSPFFLGLHPGTYTISVPHDGITETSRPFTIGFQPASAPVILRHPSGTVADFGQSVTLLVNAIAYAPITYQWSKNGTPIPGATGDRLIIDHFSAADIGQYDAVVTSDAGSTRTESASLRLRDALPPVISVHPASQTFPAGTAATMSVRASGGALSYQWLKDGQPVTGATSADFSFYGTSAPADTGTYTVVVTNGSGSISSQPVKINVLASNRAPTFTVQPSSQTLHFGSDATFTSAADGSPLPHRYQWRKDGGDIAGATDSELHLHNVRLADVGSYSVVAMNDFGSATSDGATLQVDASGRLVNLSTRASVGASENVVIAGFVLGGSQSRTLLIRGVGDQLRDFGVTGVLRNPKLRIMDAKSQVVAENDDWAYSGRDYSDQLKRMAALEDAAEETGAFALRADTRDAALLTTLNPGVYSAILSGVADTTGVGLVEIYEVGKPDESRLLNLSTRAFVGTNSGILISGLVLNGESPRRLLIRAVGPGLADFGVQGALSDSTLTVHRGDAIVAENDNWSDQANLAQIVATAAKIGAFPLKAGSKDSVLLIDLPAGAYSVHISGTHGATGVALVEIYEVPAE